MKYSRDVQKASFMKLQENIFFNYSWQKDEQKMAKRKWDIEFMNKKNKKNMNYSWSTFSRMLCMNSSWRRTNFNFMNSSCTHLCFISWFVHAFTTSWIIHEAIFHEFLMNMSYFLFIVISWRLHKECINIWQGKPIVGRYMNDTCMPSWGLNWQPLDW